MRVKESLSDLIGKIISGVVVAEYAQREPHTRLFLTFSDGTAFEIWEDDFGVHIASGLGDGGVDQIVTMLERREGAMIRAFRPPHEDPNAIQRDMLRDSEG